MPCLLACWLLLGTLTVPPPSICLPCLPARHPLQRWFYCHSSLLLGRVFEMYCARLGIPLGAVKFMLRGERAFGAATPDSLKVRGACRQLAQLSAAGAVGCGQVAAVCCPIHVLVLLLLRLRLLHPPALLLACTATSKRYCPLILCRCVTATS